MSPTQNIRYTIQCPLCGWGAICIKRQGITKETFVANLGLHGKLMLHNEFIICPECYHFMEWNFHLRPNLWANVFGNIIREKQ